jgi:hypothetical protein
MSESGNLNKVVCPESTIESANRRSFVRKAALTAAALGVAGSAAIVPSRIQLPESSASSAVCGPHEFKTCSCGATAVCGCAPNGVGVYGHGETGMKAGGTSTGLLGHSNSGKGILAGSCTGTGLLAYSCYSALPLAIRGSQCIAYTCANRGTNLTEWQYKCGRTINVVTDDFKVGIRTCNPKNELCVFGSIQALFISAQNSTSLPCCNLAAICGNTNSQYISGVRGISLAPYAVPLVAMGCSGQTAPLQKWQKGCTVKSVVSPCGWLGVGTCAPSNPLTVVGTSPQVGTFKSSSTSGDRSSLVQFQNACTTPVTWNAGVAGCSNASIPKGFFYLQKCGANYCKSVVINENGSLGLGVKCPSHKLCVGGTMHASCKMGIGTQTINTNLALNGSMSARAKIVKTTYPMTASDYAILANGTSPFTITLPAADTGGSFGTCIGGGMIVFVKNIGTATVTLSPKSGDSIETSTSGQPLSPKDGIMLIADGAHTWWIQARSS